MKLPKLDTSSSSAKMSKLKRHPDIQGTKLFKRNVVILSAVQPTKVSEDTRCPTSSH